MHIDSGENRCCKDDAPCIGISIYENCPGFNGSRKFCKSETKEEGRFKLTCCGPTVNR
jgi:hypothetical protein